LKRKKRKVGALIVLSQMREVLDTDKAYLASAIAKKIGKSVPATRRYLRVLEVAGLLLMKKKGRYKYYALVDTRGHQTTLEVKD